MTTISPIVLVLMGVSGCGKSTIGAELSRRLGWPFRDADTFHPPANIAKMSQAVPLTDEDRWPWLDAIAAWIDDRLAEGQPGIVSCSALKRVYRRRLIGGRKRIALVHLEGDKATIAERLAKRSDHFMPATLLDSQIAALEPPGAGEAALVVRIAEPPESIAGCIIEGLRLSTVDLAR